MSCNCRPVCNPSCTPEELARNLDQVESGSLIVHDDCSNPRVLSGDGVIVSENGDARATDGSSEKGMIPLNPDDSAGADVLLATVRGHMVSLGKLALEGSVLVRRGGKWIVGKLDEEKTLFDPDELSSTSVSIAGFACGEDGRVRLGTYKGSKLGYIMFDENGDPISLSESAFIQALALAICANLEERTEEETATHRLVCTSDGLKKEVTEDTDGIIIHQKPWAPIHHSILDWNPNQDMASFLPEALTGYDPEYKTMWLKTNLIAGTLGIDYQIYIYLDDQELHYGYTGENAVDGLGADFINSTYVFPVAIGDASVRRYLRKQQIFTTPDPDTPASSPIFPNHHYLHLVGWSK